MEVEATELTVGLATAVPAMACVMLDERELSVKLDAAAVAVDAVLEVVIAVKVTSTVELRRVLKEATELTWQPVRYTWPARSYIPSAAP